MRNAQRLGRLSASYHHRSKSLPILAQARGLSRISNTVLHLMDKDISRFQIQYLVIYFGRSLMIRVMHQGCKPVCLSCLFLLQLAVLNASLLLPRSCVSIQVEPNSGAMLLSASSLPSAATVSTESQHQLTVKPQPQQQRSQYISSASSASSLSARPLTVPTEQQASTAENDVEQSSSTALLTTSGRCSHVRYLFINGTARVTSSVADVSVTVAVAIQWFRSKTRSELLRYFKAVFSV